MKHRNDVNLKTKTTQKVMNKLQKPFSNIFAHNVHFMKNSPNLTTSKKVPWN